MLSANNLNILDQMSSLVTPHIFIKTTLCLIFSTCFDLPKFIFSNKLQSKLLMLIHDEAVGQSATNWGPYPI